MCLIISEENSYNLKLLLQSLSKYDIDYKVKCYTKVEDTLFLVQNINPKCLFINISTLENSVKHLINKIKQLHPQMHIVIISQSSTFAIDAFTIGVTDYLLLPIQPARIKITINRIFQNETIANNSISMFNSLKVMKDGDYFGVKWRTKKSQELFAYLFFKGNEHVRKDLLVDLLWPDISWEKGIALLYANMYHVRSFIKRTNLNIEIQNSENYYILYKNDVQCQVNLWKKKIANLRGLNSNNVMEYYNIIYEYKGDFLRQTEYNWAENERQYLRLNWLKIIEKLVQRELDRHNISQIKKIAYYMMDVCPDVEEGYFYLMKALYTEGQIESVIQIYKSLSKMVWEEYDAEPSIFIIDWFNEKIGDERL